MGSEVNRKPLTSKDDSLPSIIFSAKATEIRHYNQGIIIHGYCHVALLFYDHRRVVIKAQYRMMQCLITYHNNKLDGYLQTGL